MIDGFTSKNLFKDDKVRDSVEHDFGFSDVHLEEYAIELTLQNLRVKVRVKPFKLPLDSCH